MLYGGEVSSAVRAQDIDLLHFLLNRGGDPNESSLYAALEDAYLEDKKLSEGAISESVLRASACASCLVDAGVSIRDGDLALAIRTGNRELIAKMVRLGASLAVSTCGAYDTAPLEMAILLGASDVVEAVLQVWPDIYGGGPLCAAVLTSTSNDGFSLVKRLLQNRPLSTTADILETTAVGLAAYLREPELLGHLLAKIPPSDTAYLPLLTEISGIDDDGAFLEEENQQFIPAHRLEEYPPFWHPNTRRPWEDIETVIGSPVVLGVGDTEHNLIQVLMNNGYRPDGFTLSVRSGSP
jgi:hypothetical protein